VTATAAGAELPFALLTASAKTRVACGCPEGTTGAVNVGLAYNDDSLRQQFGAIAELVRPGVLSGTDGEIIDRIGQYVDAGAEQVNIALRAPFQMEPLQRFSAALGLSN